MKNACAASRSLLLWFQGPAYSQPPGQGMLIKAHYTTGCNQSTVQLISWVPWLSIACQQNHNEIFPSVIPENQRRWRFLLTKRAAVTWMFCVCLSLPLQAPYPLWARVRQSASGSVVFVAAARTHLYRGGKVLHYQGFMSFVPFPKERLNILK